MKDHSMRIERACVVMAVFVCVSAAALELAPAGHAALTPPTGFDEQSVAALSRPTGFAFTPDGRILIVSQTGPVWVYRNGALSSAIDLGSRICSNVERGVLGVAVDPAFADTHYVYLYYTYKNGADSCPTYPDLGPVNRLSRFILGDDDKLDLATETVLLDNVPSPSGYHNAGDIHFGRDGYMYVSVGDGFCDITGASACGTGDFAAQYKNVISGKILRISSDGGIPPNNPFAGSGSVRCNATGQTAPGQTCQEIWALGLRNPFRFTMDPDASGTKVYINDVGQASWEEIDNGQAAANYGWPMREGPCATDSYTDCGPPAPGLTNPIFAYQHTAGCTAITGGAFVPRGVWPSQYDGSYLYADLICGKVMQLVPDGSGGFTSADFAAGQGNLIELGFGPYGSTQALYYLTWSSGLRRIAYTGSGNRTPHVQLGASPTYGNLPLTVNFDASESSDPDSDPLTVDWDFGDGSPHQSGATAQHTYTTAGTYTAKVTISDGRGGSDRATVRIDAGNNAPVPAIQAPAATDRFSVGQTITLTGSATDPEDGNLSSGALSWEVVKHHATHTHPFLPPTSGNNVQITGPPPEDFYSTTNSYLEIRLSATDSRGLTATVSRNLNPHLVQLGFATKPAGLRLTGNSVALPASATSWEGWNITVDAPDQRDAQDLGETFVSWSDGGAQTHVIKTPGASSSYTATFTKNYARPRGAASQSLPLVPAYQPCGTANATHGSPLAYGSCMPAAFASSYATFGTPDVNGLPARSIGHVRLRAIQGDPSTPQNEADVVVSSSITDVLEPNLADYVGELQTSLDVRLTDKQNGTAGTDAATTNDFTLTFAVPCVVTIGTGGSTCSSSTSVSAVMPDAVVEGKRAIWQLGAARMYDGGSDGVAATAGNTLLATQGVFVP